MPSSSQSKKPQSSTKPAHLSPPIRSPQSSQASNLASEVSKSVRKAEIDVAQAGEKGESNTAVKITNENDASLNPSLQPQSSQGMLKGADLSSSFGKPDTDVAQGGEKGDRTQR